MTIDSAQLLKQLEPAVRPAAAPATGRAAQAPLEQQGFDELLALVSQGSVHSGRAVTIDAGAGLEDELDAAQLERLAAAADVAEASGARRAVMLIDGRALVLDVAGRIVTDELSSSGETQLIDVDAAVYVAGEDEPADAAPPMSSSAARTLEQLQSAPPTRGGAAN